MGRDTIALRGLTVTGYHGVFDHERRDGQPFVIDLELKVDTARAADTDDVADTVHYGEVAQRVAAIVSGDPVNLIETLAHRIADDILSFAALVTVVRVTVHKPEAPIPLTFADVSVTVTKERA